MENSDIISSLKTLSKQLQLLQGYVNFKFGLEDFQEYCKAQGDEPASSKTNSNLNGELSEDINLNLGEENEHEMELDQDPLNDQTPSPSNPVVKTERVEIFPRSQSREEVTPFFPQGEGYSHQGYDESCDDDKYDNLPNSFKNDLLSKYETILDGIKDIKSTLRNMNMHGQEGGGVDEIYTGLPLETIEDLNNMETLVQDPAQFRILVNKLKRVGGVSVKKSTNNCLRRLMSRPLAQQIRFTDTSGKYSFGKLKLADVCREAIRSMWDDKSASDTILNGFISSYFRNTGERKPADGSSSSSKITKTTSSATKSRKSMSKRNDSSCEDSN